MAPIRCPVSCASTSATRNRQSTCRDNLQKRPVFLLGQHDPGRVLLRGRPQALQRVRAEERAALLVPRLRGPVEDRDQKLQVGFDGPVRHGPAARADRACPPRPDEPVPVPLGERFRLSVAAEEPEEHLPRGPVVQPGRLTLGGRHLITVDVKKRLQGERLGLGVRLAVQLRPSESRGELIRLPLRPHPVAGAQATGSACARSRATRPGTGRSWDREILKTVVSRLLPSGPVGARKLLVSPYFMAFAECLRPLVSSCVIPRNRISSHTRCGMACGVYSRPPCFGFNHETGGES